MAWQWWYPPQMKRKEGNGIYIYINICSLEFTCSKYVHFQFAYVWFLCYCLVYLIHQKQRVDYHFLPSTIQGLQLQRWKGVHHCIEGAKQDEAGGHVPQTTGLCKEPP